MVPACLQTYKVTRIIAKKDTCIDVSVFLFYMKSKFLVQDFIHLC